MTVPAVAITVVIIVAMTIVMIFARDVVVIVNVLSCNQQ